MRIIAQQGVILVNFFDINLNRHQYENSCHKWNYQSSEPFGQVLTRGSFPQSIICTCPGQHEEQGHSPQVEEGHYLSEASFVQLVIFYMPGPDNENHPDMIEVYTDY